MDKWGDNRCSLISKKSAQCNISTTHGVNFYTNLSATFLWFQDFDLNSTLRLEINSPALCNTIGIVLYRYKVFLFEIIAKFVLNCKHFVTNASKKQSLRGGQIFARRGNPESFDWIASLHSQWQTTHSWISKFVFDSLRNPFLSIGEMENIYQLMIRPNGDLVGLK